MNVSKRHERAKTKMGSVPRRFKPPRDVNVPVIAAVACPTCFAPVGEKCCAVTTGKISTAHPSRRRMAVRLRNQQEASMP